MRKLLMNTQNVMLVAGCFLLGVVYTLHHTRQDVPGPLVASAFVLAFLGVWYRPQRPDPP